MAADSHPFLSPEEYLEIERNAPTKSEYAHGQKFAMAGATLRHARIVMNLGSSLHERLKGRNCATYANDVRLHVPSTGLYT